MSDYVDLGKTLATDKIIRPQPIERFDEEANDIKWVGQPADVKGKKDIEE